MLSKPLEFIHLCYLWLKSYPYVRRVWNESVDGGDRSEIRINYGFERVPSIHEHVFGGKVKLQDLGTKFPHFSLHPNILYLVSSALPYFPLRLAAMAKRSGAKVVINQNGVAYQGWYGKGWEKHNKSMQALLAIADYVIYQSKFCKKSADKFLGECHAPHDILYNPVDTRIFRPADKRDSDNRPVTLLLAGSHWNFYRPKTAVEVVHHLKRQGCNVRLNIAGRYCWGKSPEEAAWQVSEYAVQLGVAQEVKYIGPYTQKEAVNVLQECQVLLHTKYNDPCPRLVVEAMACGLPVVYSATGGVPELVGEKAGVGVPGPINWDEDHPPDAELLAAAMLAVLKNRREYASQARMRATRCFDVEMWFDKHRTIFSELLAQS